MRSSPISVEERFRNQFKQIHSSTYDKRLFGRERMPAQERDEDDDVPTATTSASFEFSADLSRRMNNNNDRILSNFLRAGSSHSNDRTMRPADDEEDDGTTCTTRDTSLESAAALSDAFKCTKRSASVPNSSSDGEATSERERSLSLPSKLTGPPFGDSMMSGDSGFVQEHGQKDSRQSTPPNPDPPTTSAVNLASEMSYQMFLNQLCRQQQEKQQEDDIVVLSNSPQKRSLAASTSERVPTEWKRRRSGSPQSRGSPARIDGPPIASTLAQSFLLPSFGALSAFQQQMMMSHPESGMLGQSPQAMAAFLSHLKNTNFGKSFDDSIRHEAATPQTTHPHQLMNSLIMAASGGNSSDDDWESMMEVSNTDEAEKIRMMVGDKAAPVTDPNQCLMCRRVLSCKSALQMHYRTHTGERPFKCKICQRAFTTKGNLKTHMSVHKSKHSIQATPPLIAGHGSMHPFLGLQSASPLARPMIDRGEKPPAAFLAAASQNQCPFCLKRFPAAAFIQQHIMQQHAGLLMPVGPRLFFSRPPLLGTPPTTQQLGAIATAAGKPPLAALTSFLGTAPPPFDSPTAALQRDDAMTKHSRTPPSPQSTPAGWDSAAKRQTSPTLSVSPSASSQRLSQFSMSALCSEKQKRPATDGADSGEPALGQQPLDSLKALMGDGQLPQNALHQLLLSSFIKNASNLDIEPNCAGGGESAANFFSPTAFYGLTGRIEDGPSSESDPSTESVEAQSDADAGAPDPKRPKTEPINEPQPSQMASFAVRADSETATGGVTSGALPSSLEAMEKMCAVAEPASSPLLMAPLSKHQCGVCRKNFSSSSALQIHIRTHTGERPFKCDICSHTFTTRGNLKVHMGTHSYQPNPPRRGRRIFDYHMSGGAGSPVEPDMSPSLLGRQGVAGFGPTTVTPQTPQTAPLAFPAFLAAAVAASAAVVATGGTTTPLDALLNSGSVLPPSLLAAAFSAASATPQPQLPAEDAAPASPLAACPICRASFATAAEMQSHFESHIAAFAEATADKFDDGDEAASASADAGRLNGGSDGSQPLIGAKLFV